MDNENGREGLITEKQKKYLDYLRSKIPATEFQKIMNFNFKEGTKIEELTTEEASLLIQYLKDYIEEKMENEKEKREDRMQDYITFEQLLSEAHQKFKKLSIETELISKEKNEYIIKATVKTEKGVYIAHGDANEENTTRMVSNALLRMAETRAVARALRFATGIGKTAREEIEEIE